MDTAKLLDFFSAVLPATGPYYLNVEYRNDKRIETLEELARVAAALVPKGRNTFFGTAAYGKGECRRNADSVSARRVIHVDVDCGMDRHGEFKLYKSKADGLTAIRIALAAGAMPKPTALVDSGNGYHLYWRLDRDVDYETGCAIARSVIGRLKNGGLDVDIGVTADCARILRVPGSTNTKAWLEPSECQLLARFPTEYDPAQFLAAPPAPKSTAPTLLSVSVEDLTERPTGPAIPRFAKHMANECPAFRHAVDTGGAGYSNDLWGNWIHLLTYMEDGHEYAHITSKGYAGYTEQETEARYQRALKTKNANPKLGPTLCESIAQHRPECATCKHRAAGTIKTPFTLGGEPDTHPAPPPLRLPDNYKQDRYGTWFVKRGADGEADDLIQIAPMRFTAFYVYTDDQHGDIVVHWTHAAGAPAHQQRKSEYPMSYLSGNDTLLANQLAKAGIILQAHQLKRYKEMIVSWIQQLQGTGSTHEQMRTMGWHTRGDLTGFATGDRVFWSDGSETPTVLGDAHVGKIYSPAGSAEVWDAAAAKLLAQAHPALVAIVASAFAAPLMRFSGVPGGLLSVQSQRSGTGKTTATKIAQAVWGDPHAGVHALDDTPYSVVKKLGLLNHLPGYWDEIRMSADVGRFCTLVFQLAQGKERSRLNARAEMQEVRTWQTLLIGCSNDSLMEHMKQTQRASNAGEVRVLELCCDDAVQRDMDPNVVQLLSSVNHNYGWAGQRYAKWLACNADFVRERVARWLDTVSVQLGQRQDERFRVAIVAVLCAGAEFATRSGACTFNVKQLAAYLMRAGASAVQETVDEGMTNGIDMVNEYLAAYSHAHIMTNTMPAAPGKTPAAITVISEPKAAPIGGLRYHSTLDGVLMVNAGDLLEWAHKKGYSLLRKDLRNMPGVTKEKRTLGRGCGARWAAGQVHVYTFRRGQVPGLQWPNPDSSDDPMVANSDLQATP